MSAGAPQAAGVAEAAPPAADPRGRIDQLAAARVAAGDAYFEREAERLARLCHRMAERFARGGRLLSLGSSPAARSDARHVAVEFVHPVIVGKRALPALGLAPEGGDLALQVESLAEPEDIVFAYADGGAGGGERAGAASGGEPAASAEIAAAIRRAGARGCLTVAFCPGTAAEWSFGPASADPFVAQEQTETLYHLLWELVHVFFDHRGLLAGPDGEASGGAREGGGPGQASGAGGGGATGFLYPFLSSGEHDLDAVLDDVRASALTKARAVGELRERTLADNADTLIAAAVELRRRLDAGGKLLAFGNGGSATDATDLVADLRAAPAGVAGGPWPARRAIDLTEDPSILTAIANDVGVEQIFQRQLIAYGGASDVAVGFSTSGGSPNLLAALAEARRQGMATVAVVGYGGGRIAAEGLADHVAIVDSQDVPRIQEAQASAYHVLRELIEADAIAELAGAAPEPGGAAAGRRPAGTAGG